VDVMRNALGVGPCQYVLDAEGLGNSESPTPDVVTHWVEKQLEKKVSKRDVEGIGEQLKRMSEQVKKTDERAGQYMEFAARMKSAIADYAKDHAQAAGRLGAIVERMTRPEAAGAVVEKLAGEVAQQADKEDGLAKAQGLLAAIRTAGARQDYGLAKLRMAARRLKQAARTLAVSDPAAAGFAGSIEQQAEKMLVTK
jgi:hypothetical protein